MPMKFFHRTAFATCVVLVVLAVAGTVLVRYGISPVPQQAVTKVKQTSPGLVDERPLITAQRLAALATTSQEQDFAQEALRIADHEVDMAFAAALHQAAHHPPPVPAAALPILTRVQSLQERVKTRQNDISRLKQQVAKADGSRKSAIEDDLHLQEATLEVDKEELDEARQELIQAGGDPRARIQQLIDQHEALGHDHAAAPAGGAPGKGPAALPEAESRTLLVQFRAWRRLVEKQQALAMAREEAQAGQAVLAREHQALDEATREAAPKEGVSAHQHSAPAPDSDKKAALAASPSSQDVYSTLQEAAQERKHLAELDKRSADFQQLDALYARWSAGVEERAQAHRAALIEGCLWILALLILVLFANLIVRSLVARLAPESRRRHTVHTVARVGVQVAGVVLILLVLFGPPSQLATVLALTGAGLTVALKDFIVGFFGWFILMGPNGIRPGDWVEINGIGGEVVSVGLLHTVILETGNWSDAGHPTGRKVNFVNSFAIEGHYFNFSTTGQWLWDEVEVPIPAGVDPYPIAEAVHKTVVAETETNMRLAEQEWQRAVPGHVGRTFAPVPAIMVRPTQLGVNVIVRYITRAHERHELRSRLFHKIVELLRKAQIASGPLEGPAAKSAGAE
ncbi:MAG TPA: mechanosensitive ion channel domain-containing protein [Candidatus Angelobacter sp.]|nr:mechanosensitive ion channel domain-containing protein [Candidatus Angelobacter sp.]